jgi:LCP family protein required for cell wall assembly
MTERPPTGDGREPEFDWLYGQGGAPAPGSPSGDPDATRRMPVQPRGASTPPPSPGPTPAPARGSGGPSLPRPRRPRFRVRYLVLLLVLWIAFLVAVPVYAWTKISDVRFEPKGERPGDQPGTTYLMVGSDSRAGLTPEERKEYGTGNASGQRTDTIMLLHTGSGPDLLMSIPRDSLVDVPGYGTTKINAAYAFGGPKLLVQTLEQNTGIRIDQYVEIGIGGFVDLVDAVGGVQICPKMDMDDPLANLDVEKGCQQADGPTALGYARSRHLYTQLGDVQRAQAQREVVSGIGDEVLSPWSVLNPVRYWRLNMAATNTVTFGKGTSPVRAGLWAMAMARVNGSGLTCGVPISDLSVRWDAERAPKMFQAIIDDDTDRIGKSLCSPSGLGS